MHTWGPMSCSCPPWFKNPIHRRPAVFRAQISAFRVKNSGVQPRDVGLIGHYWGLCDRERYYCLAWPSGWPGAIPHGASMPFQFIHVTERAQACPLHLKTDTSLIKMRSTTHLIDIVLYAGGGVHLHIPIPMTWFGSAHTIMRVSIPCCSARYF